MDGEGSAAGAFTTPSDDPDAPVRLAAIADYGIGGDEQYAVARTIAAGRPDLVLTAGDNSYLSAPDIALDRNVFRPMAELMRNAHVHVGLGELRRKLQRHSARLLRLGEPFRSRPEPLVQAGVYHGDTGPGRTVARVQLDGANEHLSTRLQPPPHHALEMQAP